MHSAKHAVPAAGALAAVSAAVAIPAAFSTAAPVAPAVHAAESAVLDARVVHQLPAARPLVTRVTSASSGKSYTVAAGDTLSGIAGQVCGGAGEWQGIWHQNQAAVPNPDLIYPGQKLTFTCDGSELLAPASPGPAVPQTAQPAPQHPAAQAPAGSGASAAVTGVSGGTLSFSGLEALWEAAGGPAADAAAAARVAECESGGQQYAKNPYSPASGYWQILGQVVPGNVFDPLVNAENAVSKFRASGNTWAQWVCQP